MVTLAAQALYLFLPLLVAAALCGVVLRYLPETKVHIVPGSERNIKVTYPHDLAVAEALLRSELNSAPPA